jgi:hypothetical protein
LSARHDRAGFSTEPPGQRPGLLVPSPPVRARRETESVLVNWAEHLTEPDAQAVLT